MIQRDRFHDRGAQPFGKAERIGRFADRLDRHEFVAAKACDEFARHHRRLHALADRDQQVVAGGMAMNIVDLFEAVEIDR